MLLITCATRSIRKSKIYIYVFLSSLQQLSKRILHLLHSGGAFRLRVLLQTFANACKQFRVKPIVRRQRWRTSATDGERSFVLFAVVQTLCSQSVPLWPIRHQTFAQTFAIHSCKRNAALNLHSASPILVPIHWTPSVSFAQARHVQK